jgi:integrase
LKSNPVRGVALYKTARRERFLSGEELQRLGQAMDTAEAQWKAWQSRLSRDPKAAKAGENPFALAAIRLLVLTGARKSEILGLRWNWVDFERGQIRLPDSKTGAKTIPLGTPALKVLQSALRIEGNPFVFPGDKQGAHLVGLPRVWSRIKLTAHLPDVRLHDLRHSFASVAVAGGDSLYLVGKVLGHAQSRTTERFRTSMMTPCAQ